MHTPELQGTVRIDLFVRDQLPPPTERQTERVRTRLHQYESRGAIDTLSTDTWPRRVRVEAAENGVRDTYLAYTSWARAAGVDLTPFFSVRERHSPESASPDDWLMMPALCLAVSVDGTLRAVYPHRTAHGCVTVPDALDHLERQLFDETDQVPATAD